MVLRYVLYNFGATLSGILLRDCSLGKVHCLTSEERCMLVWPVGIGSLVPLLESL